MSRSLPELACDETAEAPAPRTEAPAQALHPATWTLLRALRAGQPLSRNRHFELYERAEIRRARSLHRFLTSVAADLAAHPDSFEVRALGSAAGAGGRFALRIDFPRLNGRRTAYLSLFELELLAEQAPELTERLRRKLSAAP